ncbi:nuclear pore complex-interacting protein family member B7-like [Pan troglodytes]|uniref:nuclear pore complex-interacting protein family member B7-like n=1 Tax=Pan troglodytes TaxID=9598 RepID=UPI003013C695
MEMSLPWDGEEQLPAFRFLTFSSPHPNQGLRYTCMHTKKMVLSFPGMKNDQKVLFASRSSMEAEVQPEIKKMKMKVDSVYKIYRQRTTTEEEKMTEDTEEQQKWVEDYYRCQSATSERKAHDNWLCV